jgi:Xaa-Pro aminopeptidase
MRHGERLDALAARIETPLLVSHLSNIRYLTGFSGSSAYLLARPGEGSTFVTDGRYGEAAAGLLEGLDGIDLVVSTGTMWDTLTEVLSGLEQVALEEGGVTWEFVRTFQSKTGLEPVAAAGTVEDLRRTKDEDEVAALRKAADVGDKAFADLRRLIADSRTEADLAWALVAEMRRRGGDPADWDPIVAIGPGGSIPHYESGPVLLEEGMLLLDYGCVVDGYHSDMTRTVWLGKEPDAELAEIHGVVYEAQQSGVAAVAAGVTCGAVDEAVREVLRAHGYEDQFLHSTGHGVGLEIHEAPWVRRGNEDVLRVGDVVTVEPGVYLAGKGGVRIEDTVLVGEDGPVVLNRSPREMMPA